MKNKDIGPAHLRGKTPEARSRERHDKSNLRTVKMTIRAQSAYHLKELSAQMGSRDIGRAVDKLVREHQLMNRCGTTEADYDSRSV